MKTPNTKIATAFNPIADAIDQAAKNVKLKVQRNGSPAPQKFTASNASSSESAAALGSVEDLLMISLQQNASGARQDLLAASKDLDRVNGQQDVVRQMRAMAREKDSAGIRALIDDHPFLAESEFLGKYAEGAIDFEALSEDIESQLESLSGLNSTAAFQLQVLATRATQAEALMSTVFKKFSDSADRIIGNI